MTDSQTIGKLLVVATRTETKVDGISKALAAHEVRDDERFASLRAQAVALQGADDTSRTEALADARAALARRDDRRHDWMKGVGLMVLGAVVSAIVALVVRALS